MVLTLVDRQRMNVPVGHHTLGPYRAFGDESLATKPDGKVVYSLSAMLVTGSQSEQIRHGLRQLHPLDGTKLHWRKSSTSQRPVLMSAILRCDFRGVLVSVEHPPSTKEERLRRWCLIQMLPELDRLGCGDLILESRNQHLDRREREVLLSIFGQAHRPLTARLSHARGADEPLLWLADIVCGAFTMAQRGDSSAWDLLSHRITHIALDDKGYPIPAPQGHRPDSP